MTCFPVYNIETSPLLAANTIVDHGIQIPEIIQYSQAGVQPSLTVDFNLVVNEQYSATITAINAEGKRHHNVTVEFGMIVLLV